MKVLVIGGGGREHALVWKIKQSSIVDEVFCSPGNAGIAEIAQCFSVMAEDIPGQIALVKSIPIDLVIVGPEVPLAEGIVDVCQAERIKAFGPTKRAALIESDKVFAKRLMDKKGIPTAKFSTFTNPDEAKIVLKCLENEDYPRVIKASGLCAGKGSIMVKDKEEALAVVDKIMRDRIFGEAGNTIVLEEYLEGDEVSLLVFTDGKDFVPLLASQDHKPVFDGDEGPNTGGMGAYAPVPFLGETDIERIIEKVHKPAVWRLKQDLEIDYKGVLYAGLILTDQGPKVLEFNCRFGDPETQPIFMLLETDLMEPLLASIEGNLKNISLKWKPGYATCVVLASGGYPGKYEKGKEITGLDKVTDAVVFHAGTKKEGDKWLTNGGRILGVTGIGKDLQASNDLAYREVAKIEFDGMHCRFDIGDKGLTHLMFH